MDFTNQVRDRGGVAVRAALLEACPIRLRPILMTSFATIAAALPLALALGPGAELRAPMAIAVIGGVLVSTLLTLFVVPCVYELLARFERNRGAVEKRRARSPRPRASRTEGDNDRCRICRALNDAAQLRRRRRAGHGAAWYLRLTVDVDLVVDLAPEEVTRVVHVLESLGYKPRLPVPAAQLADAAKRKEWIEQEGDDGVFVYHPSDSMLTVDVSSITRSRPRPPRAERLVIADVRSIFVPSTIDRAEATGRQAAGLDRHRKLRRIQEKNVANAKSIPEEERLWPVTWDEVKGELRRRPARHPCPAPGVAGRSTRIRTAGRGRSGAGRQ